MSKPKILLLGKLPPPYMGPAIATQILLNSKLNEHFTLLHLNTAAHGSLDAIGTWSFSKVWKNISLYARMARVVWREKPAIVLVPISQSTLGFLKDSIFILLSRLFRRKTLIHLRGSNFKNWLAGASWPARAYVEGVVRTTQGVIVLGHNLRYLFADYYPDERIFVVPNGANYQIATREASRKNGQVKVLYLANLQPSKGIEDVIQGVAVLKERGVNSFTLDVVGAWRDEKTRAVCLQLVAERNLPVTFHGPAYGEDKFAFMAQSEVFVFPPREPEGHPWVIVEALAAGLPIISTDQGAIVESVRHGVNGFIVDSPDAEQVADRMQQLIQHPALREKQGQASRQHYREHFTEEAMVARLRAAFEHLLQHP